MVRESRNSLREKKGEREKEKLLSTYVSIVPFS